MPVGIFSALVLSSKRSCCRAHARREKKKASTTSHVRNGSESSVAATAGALCSATSPISILSPDALVRVLEHLGTDLLFVASVDHSFLRACEHYRVWRLVERSRRRSVGSYLRGCYLRLRLELSVVTDPRPSDRVRKDAEYWTNYLSSDPRPTDGEYRRSESDGLPRAVRPGLQSERAVARGAHYRLRGARPPRRRRRAV